MMLGGSLIRHKLPLFFRIFRLLLVDVFYPPLATGHIYDDLNRILGICSRITPVRTGGHISFGMSFSDRSRSEIGTPND